MLQFDWLALSFFFFLFSMARLLRTSKPTGDPPNGKSLAIEAYLPTPPNSASTSPASAGDCNSHDTTNQGTSLAELLCLPHASSTDGDGGNQDMGASSLFSSHTLWDDWLHGGDVDALGKLFGEEEQETSSLLISKTESALFLAQEDDEDTASNLVPPCLGSAGTTERDLGGIPSTLVEECLEISTAIGLPPPLFRQSLEYCKAVMQQKQRKHLANGSMRLCIAACMLLQCRVHRLPVAIGDVASRANMLVSELAKTVRRVQAALETAGLVSNVPEDEPFVYLERLLSPFHFVHERQVQLLAQARILQHILHDRWGPERPNAVTAAITIVALLLRVLYFHSRMIRIPCHPEHALQSTNVYPAALLGILYRRLNTECSPAVLRSLYLHAIDVLIELGRRLPWLHKTIQSKKRGREYEIAKQVLRHFDMIEMLDAIPGASPDILVPDTVQKSMEFRQQQWQTIEEAQATVRDRTAAFSNVFLSQSRESSMAPTSATSASPTMTPATTIDDFWAVDETFFTASLGIDPQQSSSTEDCFAEELAAMQRILTQPQSFLTNSGDHLAIAADDVLCDLLQEDDTLSPAQKRQKRS